jgi:hypothetical protein
VKRAISGQTIYTIGSHISADERALLRAAYRRERERDTARKRRSNKQKHRGRKR